MPLLTGITHPQAQDRLWIAFGRPSSGAAESDSIGANIAEGAVECRHLDVSVDTSDFVAGGQVAVTVVCEASFADIAMLAVPGSRTFEATAIEVIDTHRADSGGAP